MTLIVSELELKFYLPLSTVCTEFKMVLACKHLRGTVGSLAGPGITLWFQISLSLHPNHVEVELPERMLQNFNEIALAANTPNLVVSSSLLKSVLAVVDLSQSPTHPFSLVRGSGKDAARVGYAPWYFCLLDVFAKRNLRSRVKRPLTRVCSGAKDASSQGARNL